MLWSSITTQKSQGSKPLIKETFFKIIREEMDGKKEAN